MTNDKIQMTNEIQMTKGECSKQKYDLEERTSIFAKRCITICRLLKIDTINMILTGQLV